MEKNKNKDVSGDLEASLERLLLESRENKYELIVLAARWAKEKYKKAKAQGNTNPEIEEALLELLKGDIAKKDIVSLAPFKNQPSSKI